MKKWITCLLLAAMLTGLTACGGGESAEPSSGGDDYIGRWCNAV